MRRWPGRYLREEAIDCNSSIQNWGNTMSATDQATLSDTEAEEFRARCRAFLEQNATGMAGVKSGDGGVAAVEAAQLFQKKLVDAGLAGLTFPTEFGGAGLSPAHERIWREEYGSFPDMTSQLIISHGMCLPVLNDFASPELKQKYMPSNISGESVWCQMFSEPGAGSDVASLQTKAERDGDEWIINGQKVWTTLAHVCDYGVLIARTDPDQPKHAGISMFMVDMRDPAVEIRSIHQIDGGRHFNEVFFTDLRIPAEWMLGDYNEGWRQATAMLMYERVAIGAGSTSGITTPHSDRLIKAAKANGSIDDPVLRQEMMRVYSAEFAKSLVSMRTRAGMKAGRAPGPGGSIGKLFGAKIMGQMRELVPAVVGSPVMGWEASGDDDKVDDYWTKMILTSFQASIAGGTDEIQKNIIGDRVLGLPREPSVDKGVPFKELTVGTQKS